MPGGGLPWQVRAFAGGGEGRMPMYKSAMALGIGGAAYWWWSTGRELEQKQEEAVERWGSKGEKAPAYGGEKQFKEGLSGGEHFPGLPTTTINTGGGHPGGTKP